MKFKGSKSKYAKSIVPKLQKIINDNNIDCYVEPFVGGANIIDKIHCNLKIGCDKNATLIALHQKVQKDFDGILEHNSRELWDRAKEIYKTTKGNPEEIQKISDAPELWEIGAIAFLGSYNAGGFSSSYANSTPTRDFYNEAYRNLLKQSQEKEYKNIHFIWVPDYTDIKDIPDLNNKKILYYCDPPYQGTAPYGYAFESKFVHENYWNWVRELSKKAYVVCSEQYFPNDFEILWEKEVTRTMCTYNDFKATEKLGYYKNGLFKGFN